MQVFLCQTAGKYLRFTLYKFSTQECSGKKGSFLLREKTDFVECREDLRHVTGVAKDCLRCVFLWEEFECWKKKVACMWQAHYLAESVLRRKLKIPESVLVNFVQCHVKIDESEWF